MSHLQHPNKLLVFFLISILLIFSLTFAGVFGVAKANTSSDVLQAQTTRSPTTEQRYSYTRGLKMLEKISGVSGEKVIKSFEDIAPDLGRYIVEFSYGEIFSRPGLDLKTRELTTVAALTAMANTAVQIPLNVHINAALNVGADRTEIVETIMNMLPYAGFPAVQNGMTVAREVFQSRNTNRER